MPVDPYGPWYYTKKYETVTETAPDAAVDAEMSSRSGFNMASDRVPNETDNDYSIWCSERYDFFDAWRDYILSPEGRMDQAEAARTR